MPLLPPGPFTAAEAAAAGVGRGRLRGPGARRLHRGVYVATTRERTLPVLVAAAQRVLPPDAVPAGTTALRLAGAPVGPVHPLRFVTLHPHQVRRPGLEVVRAASLPPVLDGVVAVPHAFVRSAVLVDLVELVAAGDLLVRLGRTTPRELVEQAAAHRGRGARAARRAASLVRERVDSAQETELRLCLVLAGLPEPECNVTVGTPTAPTARVDLLLRRFRLVLEYEGDQHRSDRHQWNRDITRYEQLSREGWHALRFTAERMQRPRAVVGAVLEALRSAGYTGPDPVFSVEWLELFSASARRRRLRNAFEVP